MFVSVNARSVRWWVLGLLAGMAGWWVWTFWAGDNPPGTRLVFEREFWPARSVSTTAGEPAMPVTAPGGEAPAGEATAAGGEVSEDQPLPASSTPSAPGSGGVAGGVINPTPGGRLSLDEYRARREQLRSREMEMAQRILDDEKASDTRKAQAQQELLNQLQRSRREIEIEQLLVAGGIQDAVVSIGEAGVQVVVPQPLSASGAARIGELVARMAGARRENVSIIDSLTAFGSLGAREESPMAR